MKTFLMLLVMLGVGFGFWAYQNNQDKDPSDATVTHVVVTGDTLHSLSKQYNTTVYSIQKLNELKDNTIVVGQELTIFPGDTTSKPEHKTPFVGETKPQPQKPANTPEKKVLAKKELPKNAQMVATDIAIDIDAKNQVYLRNKDGKYVYSGTIVYGSEPDSSGREVKTTTFIDLKGKETTLTGGATPEAVIRLAYKNKR